MSTPDSLPLAVTHDVRDRCLCLAAQRAARALARHFDQAFAPFNLTSGQFSLTMSLNRVEPPLMREVADLLAMDRTTLTAALKPLERRGLVTVSVDKKDRRGRRLALTASGKKLLACTLPIWKHTMAEIERNLPDPAALRDGLWAIK